MARLLPGGFPELTPEKQGIENGMKKIISSNYEKFGFVNIETPAVELNDVLTSKGGDEVSKQIYGLYGLKQGGEDLKDFSLHFDLTVPLARYVVDNESALKFPFKRYQMQKVWRGERQQRGRFKEFTQCDVDVIGDNLSINYDIEVIHVLYDTMKEIFQFLGIKKGIEVHLNNRKFIEGICDFFDISGEYNLIMDYGISQKVDRKKQFFRLLDDFYKITREDFGSRLREILGDDKKSNDIIKILKTSIEDLNFDDEKLNQAIGELKETYNRLKQKGVNVVFDPYITRGLDYYTGTVFETFITDYFNFGSVCSGGRFDDLVGDMRKVSGTKGVNYGGVGGSIGLTRLFARLDDSGLLNKKTPLTQAIIFNTPGSDLGYKEKIGEILRTGGISTDIYYEEAKLGRQFSYAESKNIPFGIFAGEEEQNNGAVIVKDLDTRDSQSIGISDLVSYIKGKFEKIKI